MKLKLKRLFLILLIIIFIVLFLLFNKKEINQKSVKNEKFIASTESVIPILDSDLKEIGTINRGEKVVTQKKVTKNDKNYIKIKYNKKNYLIDEKNLVISEKEVVQETEKYVRTPVTVYKNSEGIEILSKIKKGEKLEIIGFNKIIEGVVDKYKVKYNDLEGYVYSKYLVNTKVEADKAYTENGKYEIHEKRSDRFNGGNAIDADYFPREKPKFEKNIMPDEIRAYYITSTALKNIDSYIALAKESNINAFVIDIKDSGRPGYKSPIMKKYSPTNYEKAEHSLETYKALVKKAKDAGFYVIGRITVFKDYYYALDHSEHSILDVRTNKPFEHNNSYWPSAFSREVWEFNVALAKESIKEMGFNEIQFDYIRFPDRTNSYEKSGVMNLRNEYNESKVQAIQGFLFYATDEIHKENVYVSADVFGESAYTYVTAYGQYWPAISNVVDVISAMPYPDHFNKYDFGFKEVVWTIPYQLLTKWGSYAQERQSEIDTPAIARTWIQAYNAIYTPKIEYGVKEVNDQIKALKETGLTGGYMTWNSASSLEKYKTLKQAFLEG